MPFFFYSCYLTSTIYSRNTSSVFNRKPYRSINYKFPLLRKIEFPINGKLNTSFIVKEDLSGSFFDTLNRDDDYNVVVNFNNRKIGVDQTKLQDEEIGTNE